MPIENANDFVLIMKQDKSFRDTILSFKTVEDRLHFVRNKGFLFSIEELMEASRKTLMINKSVKEGSCTGGCKTCGNCNCTHSCHGSCDRTPCDHH